MWGGTLGIVSCPQVVLDIISLEKTILDVSRHSLRHVYIK